MKLLAGFLAAALAQDSDRWGFYDYYGNSHGKSQTSQTGLNGNQIGQQKASVIGNGRICWHCNERNYGHCLDTGGPTLGDSHRHGAAYCVGEEYFCYIHERRIIRHDGNDWDFEMRQPWSQGSADTYQEENVAFAGSNMSPDTNIRVEMGCQQPSACLRQMHQNYKIEMGMPYHVQSSDVALPTLPVVHGGLAREGMCRLGQDWRDYASGNHDMDNWRMSNWRESPFGGVWDRRYGAVRNHYHYGKGTESVCHHCCDPLLEFGNTDGDPVATPYDYMGCNFNAIMTSADISSGGTVDGAGNVDNNAFLQRSHVWDSPVWYNNMQYHGMFRNPHTQYPRNTVSYNVGGAHPNARR